MILSKNDYHRPPRPPNEEKPPKIWTNWGPNLSFANAGYEKTYCVLKAIKERDRAPFEYIQRKINKITVSGNTSQFSFKAFGTKESLHFFLWWTHPSTKYKPTFKDGKNWPVMITKVVVNFSKNLLKFNWRRCPSNTKMKKSLHIL